MSVRCRVLLLLPVVAVVILGAGCWQEGTTAARSQSQPSGTVSAAPVVVAARLIDVLDGDSLVVKHGRTETEYRLYGIDAPEHLQPWSKQARDGLRKLISRQPLRFEPVEKDRYDRVVARVYRDTDDVYVNARLVSQGHAWVYRQYTQDPVLIEAEQAARAAGNGLWQLPKDQQMPPWDWRRSH